MKENPLKSDWSEQIKKDFSTINEEIDEAKIASQSDNVYKKNIKEQMRKVALLKFNKMKEKHSKIKDITYESLSKPQSYITSNLLNNKQTGLIVNLRSRCERSFRNNFKTMHPVYQSCPLCELVPDTQEHALECKTIKEYMTRNELEELQSVRYEHLFGSTEEQAALSAVYINILSIRDRLLEEEPADQGDILDLQTSDTLYN